MVCRHIEGTLDTDTICHDERVCFIGVRHRQLEVLCSSYEQYGNTDMALFTRDLVPMLHPYAVIQIGIAGAGFEQKVGDVVYASSLLHYLEQGSIKDALESEEQMDDMFDKRYECQGATLSIAFTLAVRLESGSPGSTTPVGLLLRYVASHSAAHITLGSS